MTIISLEALASQIFLEILLSSYRLFKEWGTNYFYLSNFNAFLQVATADALEVMTIASINSIISSSVSLLLSFKADLIFPTLVGPSRSYIRFT